MIAKGSMMMPRRGIARLRPVRGVAARLRDGLCCSLASDAQQAWKQSMDAGGDPAEEPEMAEDEP